jgi:lysophospholipase L1-like esterase
VQGTPGSPRAGLALVAWVGITLAAGAALALHGWRAVSALPFHAGLLLAAAGLGGLSLCAARRGRGAAVLLLNTLSCAAVGTVAVDRLWLSGEPDDGGAPATYSFVEAGGDPRAFLRWHQQNLEEIERTRGNMIPDPRGRGPRIPRPASQGRFRNSTWHVNRLGFRGPEIQLDKGPHYRIVALGESTTFGATLEPDDRPWPELLEERIRSELACEQPVQVVNAGVPGWNLANQLARLDARILPLEPDLIVTYHGSNGFPFLLNQIPPVNVGRAPAAPPRPSRLVSRVESAVRVAWFRRRYRAARAIDTSALATEVHLSRYAELYRQLVFETRRRGIRLALCTFNMAVTLDGPEEVIRFYEPVFPDLRAQLVANRLHTLLVRQLADTYGVLAIDTSPGLDGAWEDAYVDPIHLTQLGRERLAENVFRGLAGMLSEPSPGCRPIFVYGSGRAARTDP